MTEIKNDYQLATGDVDDLYDMMPLHCVVSNFSMRQSLPSISYQNNETFRTAVKEAVREVYESAGIEPPAITIEDEGVVSFTIPLEQENLYDKIDDRLGYGKNEYVENFRPVTVEEYATENEQKNAIVTSRNVLFDLNVQEKQRAPYLN